MDQLDDLYTTLKSGLTVAAFLKRYDCVMEFVHEAGLTGDFRIAAGRSKRLRDEVAPVVRFARSRAAPRDRIQFPLDSGVADVAVARGGDRHRRIEVTAMQGTERFFVMRELNQTGWGRGFTGLTDERPKKAFVREMEQGRRMHSTAEIEAAYVRAFEIAADRKRNNMGADTLLIDVPQNVLSLDHWRFMQPTFAAIVSDHLHHEVYLVDVGSDDFCLQIK